MTDSHVQEFRSRLRGRLLQPQDDVYDLVRKVYNAAVDRRPALIARCAGAADVIECLHFAREHDLTLSVRSGGHGIAGAAVCEGGLMIDLAGMKGIHVDPVRRIATAQPGLTWGEFDRETQAFGLATPGGVVTSTGIAGLTLGGGLGWLLPKYGLTCDNLLSADMVTADGRLLHASADENPDLFWGLRGGGGNFGIVTRFEYRLYNVDTVLAGPVIHPANRFRELLRFYREWTAKLPDEVMSFPAALGGPEGPVAVVFAATCGPRDAAEKALEPLRKFGPPVADMVQPMPYLTLQSAFDLSYPPHWYHYWKSDFLKELSDAAIDTIVEHAALCPTPKTSITFLEHYHGAATRVAPAETAFANRNYPYNFAINGVSPDPADLEKNTAWVQSFAKAMRPYAAGRVYVNYLGEEGADRVREAYGPNYDRLVALKTKYDPTNLFRLNQNIQPTAVAAPGRTA